MSWIIWLAVALLLLLIELFTGMVVAMCLAVGCIVASILSACGFDLVVQSVTGAVFMVVAFLVLGPMVRRYHLHKATRASATNMDALIGRVGRVAERVTDNAADHGRVRIDGDNWLAYTTSPEAPIESGRHVRVVAYDSLVLRVEPVADSE